MKILGFITPNADVGKTSLVFNLGWVLADSGFRVALLDLDPQASLTELAGGGCDDPGSAFAALSPLLAGHDALGDVDPLPLTPGLVLVRGHLELSTLDDQLATAWGARTTENRARSLADGIARFIRQAGDDHDANVVLCDLGSNLGPLNHAIIEATDGIVVPLAPERCEATLRSLDVILQRWRASSSSSSKFIDLGFVFVGSPGSARDRGAAPAAALRDRTHLGTIQHYPGLAWISWTAHKPDVELTTADGAMGSHIQAVLDLRAQYEALATAVVSTAGLFDSDEFIQDVEQALSEALEDELPAELDALSSGTRVKGLADVELDRVEVRRGGLRATGSASVDTSLEWGGGEPRDGFEASSSFPLRFDVDLDRSHETVTTIHRLEVDTSSFHE